jgi:hypothetical protein
MSDVFMRYLPIVELRKDYMRCWYAMMLFGGKADDSDGMLVLEWNNGGHTNQALWSADLAGGKDEYSQ